MYRRPPRKSRPPPPNTRDNAFGLLPPSFVLIFPPHRFLLLQLSGIPLLRPRLWILLHIPPFLLLLSREPFLPCHLLLSLRPTVACAPPPPLPSSTYAGKKGGSQHPGWRRRRRERGRRFRPVASAIRRAFKVPPTHVTNSIGDADHVINVSF